MAQIGTPRRIIIDIPMPERAPIFTKPKPVEVEQEEERKLVPVRVKPATKS